MPILLTPNPRSCRLTFEAMPLGLTFRGKAAVGVNTRLGHTQLSWVFCRSMYHLATPALAMLARAEAIYKAEKFSDHAPITVDYDFKL